MITTEPTMTNLFLQLGLDESPDAITRFIHTHQLGAGVQVADAPFWNDAQRQFLAEQLKADAHWALVVDQFNEALHADAVERRTEAEVPTKAEAVPAR
ncbi:DUF2789 domain-containing protein [Paracidovorax cattleyae]|uniref:DUF2789 domain-containing protein n=1 Tax=Paracidovorax cattleyae TaxID=80868 RepID=A0A1H0WC83_9BURK|nr:DUF2789 domain-containing protein [Paracidovorax cattleyae]AVS74020.1 DUF2789 domain-containing protein [Paracidovorax cattleyae]MBF9265778.1 DUF2789 domain-containing protein [Paracidovorax cattleyae]SDP88277.1 Protein of unknown function [Paracidovorax cattleyae]